MQSFLQDLRYNTRMLVRQPGFAVMTILLLELGIGSTTAIFTLINASLLKRLPYPDAERNVRVINEERGKEGVSRVSYPDFADWRRQARSFETVVAAGNLRLTAKGGESAESLVGDMSPPIIFASLASRLSWGGRSMKRKQTRRRAYIKSSYSAKVVGNGASAAIRLSWARACRQRRAHLKSLASYSRALAACWNGLIFGCRHKNAFHGMTRAQFDAAVKQFDEKIPTLADHEIIVGLTRIMALVGDGHTRLNGIGARFRSGRHPVQLYLFKDGLFVRCISAEHAELVGAKVLRLSRLSAEDALSRMREITPHDNEMGVKDEAPFWFAFPEVLHALGITDDLQAVKLVAEIDGQAKTVELKPITQPPARWVDAREAAKSPVPLWLKNTGNDYWFEYLPEQKTVYVQFNVVRNKPDETVEAFFNRVFAFVAANPVGKFVLDLRKNGGGNNFLNVPIVKSVIRSNMDERGKFFTIIGRETFSAAQNLVNQLEKYTNVIFVGEPTSGRPNHYGDAHSLTLPNSGLVARASTLWRSASDALRGLKKQ